MKNKSIILLGSNRGKERKLYTKYERNPKNEYVETIEKTKDFGLPWLCSTSLVRGMGGRSRESFVKRTWRDDLEENLSYNRRVSMVRKWEGKEYGPRIGGKMGSK